ncbi:osmoprotectant transport system ATP-binding protein [Limimonas halophila]|uniref:Quaternary amine transport ATP-binding protein n=1 Tax=Limimonas halophila TaxID=1082479 RepID=A0A1G7LNN0_9PROT|nr:ABC transporter ATP-binding protein [Limimonas halophila]SDF50976.1 osmoprotectant transport system ATP-binding protein [Limimonas halophila]
MIRLENLSKSFDSPEGTVRAVDNVTLEVPEGEIAVLLGPSGCGKTTTMKMVNRLVAPTSGKIYINGQDTDTYDVIQLRRELGYVIQQIGLFPNMTVEQNISVVPRLLGWSRQAQKDRAGELMRMVALDERLLSRFPKELSGGQQQRVGVARALAADPPVLLMDEPFGAIDPINREVIQDEFLKMQAKLKKTIMFVSHDIDEAVKMGDKIAIFREGRLEQYDDPDMLLSHPANPFIADFVGGDRELKRMRLTRVETAMDTRAPTVRADDTVANARAIMEQAGAEHIVVLDDSNRPMGLIEHVHAGDGATVCRDAARPLPEPVTADRDLRTAVSSMFTYDVDWMPVVDPDGGFVGIVTQDSIRNTLAHSRRSAPQQQGTA